MVGAACKIVETLLKSGVYACRVTLIIGRRDRELVPPASPPSQGITEVCIW